MAYQLTNVVAAPAGTPQSRTDNRTPRHADTPFLCLVRVCAEAEHAATARLMPGPDALRPPRCEAQIATAEKNIRLRPRLCVEEPGGLHKRFEPKNTSAASLHSDTTGCTVRAACLRRTVPRGARGTQGRAGCPSRPGSTASKATILPAQARLRVRAFWRGLRGARTSTRPGHCSSARRWRRP